MSQRILKFEMPKQAAFTIEMPIGSQIFKLGIQNVSRPDPIPLCRVPAPPSREWEVVVVDRRRPSIEKTYRYSAADEAAVRTHYEELGFVVNSIQDIGAHYTSPPPVGSLIPVIWALSPQVVTDPDDDPPQSSPVIAVRFLSLPTGATLPEGNWAYVGTLQLPATAVPEAVFHVFVDRTYVGVV